MKYLLFIPVLLIVESIFAQNFIEAIPIPPFEGVFNSSIAFADVDGDNDLDILISGETDSFLVYSLKLFRNNGFGVFTEVINTPFEGVLGGSIAFADVDGDDDQDVLVTGIASLLVGATSKLYINDGTGNFTEMSDTPFVRVVDGMVAFADVDGDNDQDLLITGFNHFGGEPITKMYSNNGLGDFTEVVGSPFEDVAYSSIDFADIDNDNDQDVLIAGFKGVGDPISKLYSNDGLGNFTEVMNTPFIGVREGSIAFADVDGDNDQDVLISGKTSSFPHTPKLYTNNGVGSFTEMLNTPFGSVINNSIAFADVDGDNDQDLFITGSNNLGFGTSKLYLNEGTGVFSEISNTIFEDVEGGSIAFADVNGNNMEDILITGFADEIESSISKLYINNGPVSSSGFIFSNSKMGITLFPNPASSDYLYINLKDTGINPVNLSLYNLKGELIRQYEEVIVSESQNINLDISLLTPGNYFIRADSNGTVETLKFIVY